MKSRALPNIKPRRVIVFSGHMVDSPTRPKPRFPVSKEEAVRAQLARQLGEWKVGAGDLAIGGAARGGDLLCAELCQKCGAEVWLFLPLAEEEFLNESVRLSGSNWEERFEALLGKPRVTKFHQAEYVGAPDDGLNVYARTNLWIVETARSLVSKPDLLLAILVWDGKLSGDGRGGTSDFAQRVQRLGACLAPVINPMKLSEDQGRSPST